MVKCEWRLSDTFFFFLFLPGAQRTSLTVWYPYLDVCTWLPSHGANTEQVVKRQNKGRSECLFQKSRRCAGHRWHTLLKTHTNRLNYIEDLLQENLIWLPRFVVVFVIGGDPSSFFMVAGPSADAVKHSSVFSCEWDSLEEEGVRLDAWLSEYWSSSRGWLENRQWRSLPLFPAQSILICLHSLLSLSCCSLPILLTFLCSVSRQGFISCDSL